MNSIKLTELILADKNAITDRDGDTPLFALAENIALNVGNIQPEQVERSILGLNLSQFGARELSTLNSFIYYSKIKTDNIISFYAEYLRSNNKHETDSEITTRGILLRFIIERDHKIFSEKKIIAEELLRKECPWIWIDCISYYNWNLAASEISNIMETQKNEFISLLYRIPSFQKRISEDLFEQSIINWYSSMNERDRGKLDKWAKRFNIVIGLSISTLGSLNRGIHNEQEYILNKNKLTYA